MIKSLRNLCDESISNMDLASVQVPDSTAYVMIDIFQCDIHAK